MASIIEKRLLAIVLQQINTLAESSVTADNLDHDADLTSLGLNSMAAIAILKRINVEFGIDITPEQAQELRTLRSLVDHIQARAS